MEAETSRYWALAPSGLYWAFLASRPNAKLNPLRHEAPLLAAWGLRAGHLPGRPRPRCSLDGSQSITGTTSKQQHQHTITIPHIYLCIYTYRNNHDKKKRNLEAWFGSLCMAHHLSWAGAGALHARARLEELTHHDKFRIHGLKRQHLSQYHARVNNTPVGNLCVFRCVVVVDISEGSSVAAAMCFAMCLAAQHMKTDITELELIGCVWQVALRYNQLWSLLQGL